MSTLDKETLDEIKDAIAMRDEYNRLLEIAQEMADALEPFDVVGRTYSYPDTDGRALISSRDRDGEVLHIFLGDLRNARDTLIKWREWSIKAN